MNAWQAPSHWATAPVIFFIFILGRVLHSSSGREGLQLTIPLPHTPEQLRSQACTTRPSSPNTSINNCKSCIYLRQLFGNVPTYKDGFQIDPQVLDHQPLFNDIRGSGQFKHPILDTLFEWSIISKKGEYETCFRLLWGWSVASAGVGFADLFGASQVSGGGSPGIKNFSNNHVLPCRTLGSVGNWFPVELSSQRTVKTLSFVVS